MESAIEEGISPRRVATPTATPSKSRSFSDPPIAQGTLQPSPTFRERIRQGSKDDHAVPTTPAAKSPSSLRRPDFLTRGLSLQMPPRLDMPSPAHFQRAAVPLSPKLDERDIYTQNQTLSASPATSLPRHSRGIDYSRACTNLHHSTIAESSPDSSPVITQKGIAIPPRKGSIGSMMLDSPNLTFSGSMPWSSLAPERSALSSSVGSVNMMASESESSDGDEDASMGGDDQEDAIFTTPQVHKLQNPSAPTPFTGPQTPGGGATWGTGNHFSPAQASLMRTVRRTRLNKTGRRSRKSSSSASNSGYSSLASPRTTSPPPMRSIEGGAAVSGTYFPWQTGAAKSRRESLAMGTDGLHLSSGNDSGDEASLTTPSTPGVVRRPVTRRGNLLPKTKGFARIRAALLEEAAPIDTEIRRESETIRQVRERDNSVPELDFDPSARPGTTTAGSSPNLLPAVPESAQEDFDLDGELSNTDKGLGVNFATHATRNGSGSEYWNRFDPSMRTPPPPSFPRQGSSMMSDINMDSPAPAHGNAFSGNDVFWRRPRARSSASDASDAFPPTAANGPHGAASSGMNDDVHLRKFKRRREDDNDIATIKRRAVSPGLSAQNSPVLTQSPSQRYGSGAEGGWGQPPNKKESYGSSSEPGSQQQQQQAPMLSSVRSNSGGSMTSVLPTGLLGTGKKLGLQGMVDTNDGLMKMSIE